MSEDIPVPPWVAKSETTLVSQAMISLISNVLFAFIFKVCI